MIVHEIALPDSVTRNRHCRFTTIVSLFTLSAQSIDLIDSSESKGLGDVSTSALPGGFPVTKILGEESKRETSMPADGRDNSSFTQQDSADSALRQVGHAAEYFVILTTRGLRNSSLSRDIRLTLNKIRRSPSDIWPNLSKFAHVEPDRILSAVVVT